MRLNRVQESLAIVRSSALGAVAARGFLLFRGCAMPPAAPGPNWAKASEAAVRIGKASGTIYSWATRYGVRTLKVRGRGTYFSMDDLRVIEREIFHGHLVPATWQERAAIAAECPLRAAERSNRAA